MKNLFKFKILFLLFTGLLTQAALMAQGNPPIIGDLQIRGKIDASASVTNLTSLFIGINAGRNDDGNSNANTFIGVESGRSTITGAFNTAIGLNTLYSNDNGYNNTAVGAGSLYYNIGGYNNTAIGFNAMAYNTTGIHNTAHGVTALHSNTLGNYNTANGVAALYYNTTGEYNTANGVNALFANTEGYDNTANGSYALYSNTDGKANTANGTNALYSNTTGSNNIAIGRSALYLNTNRSNLVAVGDFALYNNGLGANYTFEAIYNTAVGSKALYSNTTGYRNTAIGSSALYSNTTGNNNNANGYSALYFNTTGENNNASGSRSLSSNTTGSGNAADGAFTLFSNTEGSFNTANGNDALYYNSGGSYNTANGYQALYLNTLGRGNTANGAFADVSSGDLLYATALGASSIANANGKTVIGRNAVGAVIGGYTSWSNLSDGRFKEQVKENVPGMDFIRALRPVTYIVNIDKLQRHITAQMPDTIAAKYLPTAQEMAVAKTEIKTGFIAQEVDATAKKIGYKFDGVNTPKNETDNYSIAYAQFVPSIVKGMQEQQLEIDAQQQQIKKLAAENKALKEQVLEIEELKARLERLEKLLSSTTATTNATVTSARLDQNQPNPFNLNTAIRYFIPTGVNRAELRIQDVAGKLVKTIVLEGSGEGQANLEAQMLSTGTYVYSLVLDGQVTDSKKMVLTRNN